MLKSNRAIDVIKLGDPALVLIFLSPSPPTDDGDGRRTRQTDLRKCHGDLPISVAMNNLAIVRLVPERGREGLRIIQTMKAGARAAQLAQCDSEQAGTQQHQAGRS